MSVDTVSVHMNHTTPSLLLCVINMVQVQKLQSIISSRATQYNHDTKRKERECSKLKERLNQLLVDKRDKKLGEHFYFLLLF